MNSLAFDVCWERIARAKTHRNAMVEAWNAYTEQDPYDIRVEVLPSGSGRIVIHRVLSVPPILGLELGEFLYQMRAALNACVYETPQCSVKSPFV